MVGVIDYGEDSILLILSSVHSLYGGEHRETRRCMLDDLCLSCGQPVGRQVSPSICS